MKQSMQLRKLVTTAVFAAIITVVTAYVLHIPIPTGGYIHLGDAFIYLAAALLPVPYAIAAAAIGAGLADLLTAPVWVLPTLIIKSVIVLLFTARAKKILCRRNICAVFIAAVLSPALYSIAACIMSGSGAAFLPQFLGTLTQGIGSGILFLIFAGVLDRMAFKDRITKTF